MECQQLDHALISESLSQFVQNSDRRSMWLFGNKGLQHWAALEALTCLEKIHDSLKKAPSLENYCNSVVTFQIPMYFQVLLSKYNNKFTNFSIVLSAEMNDQGDIDVRSLCPLVGRFHLWPAFVWKAEKTQVITLKKVNWGYANFMWVLSYFLPFITVAKIAYNIFFCFLFLWLF